MKKIFIDGSAGTTGLRIVERLESRDDIELIKLSEEKRKDIEARREAINSADIAFLCLPDAAAIEAVGMIENENTVVYQLDNNIQMVIRAEKKEYSEFGVLKNTIVVYEEVTKDQFMKLFTDSTKQITVYLDKNDRVDCLELLIEKN